MNPKTSKVKHLSKLLSLILSKSLSGWAFKILRHRFRQTENTGAELHTYSKERFIFDASNFVFLLLITTSIISFLIGQYVLKNEGDLGNWNLLIGLILSVSLHDILKGTLESYNNLLLESVETENARKVNSTSISNEENTKKQRYFLAYLVTGNPKFEIAELKFIDIEDPIRKERDSIGINLFEENLSKEFDDEITLRKARYILINLPDKDFLQPIALKASMHALGKSNQSKIRKDHPEYKFFKDIYAYMKAWVMCSLDCSPNNPMPISVIGLNYPSPQTPNKQLYKVAIKYIRNILLEGPKAQTFLKTPEAKQELKRCLSLLLDEIENLKIK
ncbi:hypothetical protein [Leptothoe sp. PORK10 BA2]|uniref:hypothetical protein n=1 Tax=Leptothoe sp. PORK10 BA2 TaxID=3110254 RepID=UPI002B1F4C3B|nr:hypothetical protein [Leptothoe sp. PORK10 BA2]MEA5466956.1 hypothetical protein [Leptothoe sp. PORK10 BA2]